ncbi:MAG TPA: hypothetical protein VHM28_01670, partial [Anaerolineales bacterium]|nr:hypothetical protein [Anaerolineales bacterium]
AVLSLPAGGSDLITCEYCNTTFRVPKTLTPEPSIGDLILGADFSRKPIPGWGFINEDSSSLVQTKPPELRAKLAASDMLYYVLNSSGYFDNVDASVSFRFDAGDVEYIRAGLVLRYQKGVGSYGVLISAQNTYMVGYYEKTAAGDGSVDWKTILDWTRHTALRGGLKQTNRLRVIVDGNRLRVYLNGVVATSLRDNHFELGEVLLAAEPGSKAGIEVAFSDLQLRSV